MGTEPSVHTAISDGESHWWKPAAGLELGVAFKKYGYSEV